MSRHSGSAGHSNEQNYPFAVELPVPDGGFGTQLDVMQGWAKERKIVWTISGNRFVAGQFFQTWRFKIEKDAAAFATMFGGGPPLQDRL